MIRSLGSTKFSQVKGSSCIYNEYVKSYIVLDLWEGSWYRTFLQVLADILIYSNLVITSVSKNNLVFFHFLLPSIGNFFTYEVGVRSAYTLSSVNLTTLWNNTGMLFLSCQFCCVFRLLCYLWVGFATWPFFSFLL